MTDRGSDYLNVNRNLPMKTIQFNINKLLGYRIAYNAQTAKTTLGGKVGKKVGLKGGAKQGFKGGGDRP
jgi:hypothetical protein